MKKNNHTIGNYSKLVSRIWKASFALAFALVLSMPVFAQGEFDVDPDATIPVDGGLAVLAIAGIGYGAKKMNDARKKRQQQESDHK